MLPPNGNSLSVARSKPCARSATSNAGGRVAS
jgi:hypothetical protein